MAPSVVHLHRLVARNSKLLKAAWKKTQQLIQSKLPPSVRQSEYQLSPSYALNASRHPVHRIAALKQHRSRWYSTHNFVDSAVRRFTTGAQTSIKYDRSRLPASHIRSAVERSTGRAPFASTLRPNLTGGTLGRTAGGYSLGGARAGGARYFSHSPATSAQVVQNVSQSVRAFLIGGQRARFDGINPRTGEKRWKAVGAVDDHVGRQVIKVPRTSPGSTIEFAINPTITALTPLSTVAGFSGGCEVMTLNTDGLLTALSADFSRALTELSVVLNDLMRLSALGDLPITYRDSTLSVHFPGVDADTVERLCDEVGVQRGSIRQDKDFDGFVGTEIALMFPFAPSQIPSETHSPATETTAPGSPVCMQAPIEWCSMLDPDDGATCSSAISTRSQTGDGFEELYEENPWLSASSPSTYESLHTSHARDSAISDVCSPLEYQRSKGIYRSIEHCDEAPRWH